MVFCVSPCPGNIPLPLWVCSCQDLCNTSLSTIDGKGWLLSTLQTQGCCKRQFVLELSIPGNKSELNLLPVTVDELHVFRQNK